MNTWLIIVAGGSGQRMGSEKNKILLEINGISIIAKTLMCFEGMCEGIVLVVRETDKQDIIVELNKNNIKLDNIIFTFGGATRQESVKNGISAIPDGAEVVLIHDAARPFIKKDLIRKIEREAYNSGAAILACPVYDTIKKAKNDIVQYTIDRTNVVTVQTPQAFKVNLLKEAYAYALKNNIKATDDAGILEKMGIPVSIVYGDRDNIKITNKEDLTFANRIINNNIIRIGTGFDVHRLIENRDLIICGVNIPYKKGLLGHSDADVASHALMDALLGALALGDIGRNFPDTDEKYKGANSINLLKKVTSLLKQNSYVLYQADITIIAQAPKLSPYIQQMRSIIAKATNCNLENINIKATTTENLGFCGRGEGIASQAVCIIKKEF